MLLYEYSHVAIVTIVHTIQVIDLEMKLSEVSREIQEGG